MPNLDLCKYATMLLTDGYLSKNRKTYEIGFVNTSPVLLKLFKGLSRKLFGRKKFSEYRKSSGAICVKFYSKEIAENLLKEFKTFRTKQYDDGSFPEPIFLKSIEGLSEKEISEILKLAFALDGGVSLSFGKNRNEAKVFLKCFNPHLRKQFSELLSRLNLRFLENKEGISIRKQKDIVAYYERIGFWSGVRIGKDSKRFRGLEKQRLLEFIVEKIQKRAFGATCRNETFPMRSRVRRGA